MNTARDTFRSTARDGSIDSVGSGSNIRQKQMAFGLNPRTDYERVTK